MNATAPSALMWFVAGFGIWSLCFVLLYAVQGIGCAWGWHEVAIGPVTRLHAVLAVILAAHVAALGVLCAIAHARWRSEAGNGASRLVRSAAVALSLAALISTIWTGLPAIVLPACAG